MPLHFNRTGPLPVYKSCNNTTVAFSVEKPKKDAPIVFCGKNYLLEYLSEIAVADIAKFYPNNAQEVWQAIQELQFTFAAKEGAEVDPTQPLVTVVGNPAAIELIHTTLLSVIGGQTAVASVAKSLVNHAKGAAFSYLGYRRGPTTEPIIDYAAGIGGFRAAANTLTDFNNKGRRRFIEAGLPVGGTIAHAWITSITTIHKLAIEHGTVPGLCKTLGISLDNYAEVERQSKGKDATYDLNDYIAFCAYIAAVEKIEAKIEIRTGKKEHKGVVLLVDTTNTIKGVQSALKAAIDKNREISGIRLDTTPELYIEQAWKFLKDAEQTAKKDPKIKNLFAKTKIYCTDGIDEKTLRLIIGICDKNGIPLDRIVFGIGSSIANTKALKLTSAEVSNLVQNPQNTFSLAKNKPKQDPKDYKAVNPRGEYDDVYLAADFYAQSQDNLLHELNQSLNENGVASLKEMTSHLNFRHREPPAENYLVVAGIEQALRILGNFTFDQEFCRLMRDQGLSYTDQELQDMFLGKKLNVKIDGVKEGTILSPYCPILSITGDPGHVLLVESFLLSTIGCMSSVATAAMELLHSLDFSLTELQQFSPDLMKKICSVYSIDPKFAAKPESMLQALKEAPKPTFVYWGDSERTLSTYRANAAFVGGFKETTMEQGLGIPVTDLGISFDQYKDLPKQEQDKHGIVYVDIANKSSKELDEIFAALKNKNTIQLRGDFNKNIMHSLGAKLIQHNIPLAQIKFIVREPLASAENLKGTVYKAGALKLQYKTGEGFVLYGVKAAGNSSKGGVKSSIPGVDQKLMVLKDNAGQPIAVMIIDLNLLPNKPLEKDLKNYILALIKQKDSPPILYYNYGLDQHGQDKKKDHAIDLGDFEFGARVPVDLEFITREPSEALGNFRKPATKDAPATVKDAQARATDFYAKGYHRLPVLMERSMNANLHKLLAHEYEQESKSKLRPKL